MIDAYEKYLDPGLGKERSGICDTVFLLVSIFISLPTSGYFLRGVLGQ